MNNPTRGSQPLLEPTWSYSDECHLQVAVLIVNSLGSVHSLVPSQGHQVKVLSSRGLPRLFWDDIRHPHACSSLSNSENKSKLGFGGAEGEAEWRLGQEWISSLKLVMCRLRSARLNQMNYVFLLVKGLTQL